MWRMVAGIVVGLVAWAVIATLLNFGLRLSVSGYREAELSLQFTLLMKIARLLLALFTGLGAGAVVRAVAPASNAAPWVVGLILLGLFLPLHIQIWSKLPVWYHLTFLITLAPLVPLGARLWLTGSAVAPAKSSLA